MLEDTALNKNKGTKPAEVPSIDGGETAQPDIMDTDIQSTLSGDSNDEDNVPEDESNGQKTKTKKKKSPKKPKRPRVAPYMKDSTGKSEGIVSEGPIK